MVTENRTQAQTQAPAELRQKLEESLIVGFQQGNLPGGADCAQHAARVAMDTLFTARNKPWIEGYLWNIDDQGGDRERGPTDR